MKKIFFLSLFFLTSYAIAQELPQFLIPLTAPTPSPTINNYEEALKKMKNMSKDIFNFSSWEDVRLAHKNDPIADIPFKTMSELDKSMFCLMMGERTAASIQKLEETWVGELKKFNDFKHSLIPSDNERPAIKADVENYLNKLKDFRKEFNMEYFKYAENMFSKFENEIPKTDRESFLRKIKERTK